MGVIENCRKSKKCRMGLIGAILLIVIALVVFMKKGTAIFVVIAVLLAIALGVEGFDYDADLGKLWETGSYSESRVESVTDKEGNTVRLIGECVKADVNCDGFATQGEAQAMYEKCASSIKANNPNVGDALKLDIYGLDRDKDGIVCESLP